jgi:NAD(P)H-dependent FMN reductase
MKILGISGSLRQASHNSALLRAAQALFPDLIETGNISSIPLYNGDLETEGVPDSVIQLKKQLATASGLLLFSPEYNNSVPGVLKNTIDWMSRPSEGIGNVFRGKPVAISGASPGGFGTILAQNAWLPVFRLLGAEVFSGGRLMVSGAATIFDDDGSLADVAVRERLEQYIGGFREFCIARD